MTDIAAGIWARCIENDPPFDFSRAEDCAALDKRLRAELVAIEDEHLRGHAAELIRARRRQVFRTAELRADPRHLAERIEAIEAFLGLRPRPPSIGREITSLRPPAGKRP